MHENTLNFRDMQHISA